MKQREKAAARPRATGKKEPAASGADTSPRSGPSRSPGSIGRFWIAVAGLGVLLVGALLFWLTVAQPAAQRAQRLADTVLAATADRVSLQVQGLRSRVAALANAPETLDALSSDDPALRPAREQALQQALPESLGVRLLPQDWVQADANGNVPVSNVTLDLLRQARRGEAAPLELVQPAGGKAHIALIEPVRRGNQTLAFVLVAVKPELAQQAVTSSLQQSGYLELAQGPADARKSVAQLGDAGSKSGAAPYSVAVAQSSWQVEYWPAAADSALPVMLLAIYGAGLLLMAGIAAGCAYTLIARLDRAQHQDAANLLKQILDARNGEGRIGVEGFQLAVFKDMAATLARQDWEARPAERAAQAAAAAPGVAEVSDEPALLTAPEAGRVQLNPAIFRAYDIRGVVGTDLTVEVVRQLGRAIGSEAFDRGEQKVAVARDGRTHGPELLEALKQGLMESGRDVVDLGAVPTPLLYFATHYLSSRSGVMLTGSHNPAEYNGLKIVIAGETLSGDDIQRLRERIETGNLLSGRGSQEAVRLIEDYIAQITGDVALAQPLKIVIDCGNGIAGAVAPTLYRALGCEVIELYCDVDGSFPNHHPDPSKPKNLEDLIAAVADHGADVGLAFDGDGDRLGVVDSAGKIIWPDRQMMLYSMDVLSRHPGTDIIYDVKCSRHLARVISGHGGRPMMWRTGHSLIKAKMRETGALLAGEQSGHIFFKERWFGFDDAIYTGARLLEILAADFRKSAEIFRSLPEGVSTPELNMTVADNKKHAYVERLAKQGQFAGGQINTIDGIRVDFADGWGLVRASNTTPSLVLRFEADDDGALDRIKAVFRGQMLALDPKAELPF